MSEKEDIGIPISQQEPLSLSEPQKWICRHLDALNRVEKFCPGATPSELFKGALQTMRPENRKINPDWMAQSAHSLRELLYGVRQGKSSKTKIAWSSLKSFFMKKKSVEYGSRRERLSGILRVYQEESVAAELARQLNNLHLIFTNIAHHSSDSRKEKDIKRRLKYLGIAVPKLSIIDERSFEKLVNLLESVWAQSIPRQLKLHKRIDTIINTPSERVDKGVLSLLLSFNPDARMYFYSVADDGWLDWLWKNGFIDVSKEKAKDPSPYNYRSPELDYLVKVADKVPEKVVDIMLAVTISPQHFNHEVIDGFLWICQSLPAKQLARIVPKIRDEKWVLLMEKYNRWGFEYEKLMDILVNAKHYSSLLILAEAVLEVRAKEATSKKGSGIMLDSPFCFRDLRETKVFNYLAGVDDAHVEPALALATRVMGNIVRLGIVVANDIYEFNDGYLLADVDLFTTELGKIRQIYYRADIHELAAATKKLVQKSMGTKCDDVAAVRRSYETHIKALPNSQLIWRFKLFAMSLCPDVFKEELRAAFFKIFDYQEPWELISGAEYKWALKKGFSTLSAEDREAYVLRVISCFGDEDKEMWQKNLGWCLLSSAYAGLTQDEIGRAQEVFGRELDASYQPKASMGGFKAGYVSAKAPIDQEALSRMSIPEITEKLKTEWAPEQLRKQDKDQDFLKPLSAEGMSTVLKADIVNRLKDYLANASLFFDRDHLDLHYTYAYLTGIYDVLREKKYPTKTDWSGLFKLLAGIVNSTMKHEFDHSTRERELGDAWLVGWDSVHISMADVLQELLKGNGDQPLMDFSSFRSALLEILGYLLLYPDPEPEMELKKIDEIERDPQTGAERHTGSDPFTAAINSVRGRAFQVFVNFAERDGLSLPENTMPKLSVDVKELYIKCLNAEKTQAIMFLFGHYLFIFYYRDRDWTRDIMPQIFRADTKRNELYLAAWEGYLTGDLYQELFEELADYYRRAIIMDSAQYTPRKYFTDLDKGLGTHIALAFAHYASFEFSSQLFRLFWEINNPKRHKEFISFIGRSCISRENAVEWIKTNKINIEKITLVQNKF